ncbi:MAG: nucleotidyltransferase family protein [Anaerolineae bacterium]
MKTLEEIQTILAEHRPELRAQFHARRIGIFGSYTRHHQTPLSDVDILVELDQPVGWEIVDLHRYLEDLLGMKVDLVTKGAVVRKPLLWQSIEESLVYV